MANTTDETMQPAPQSGIIWHLPEAANFKGSLNTLLGSYTGENQPLPRGQTPMLPGMSLHMVRFSDPDLQTAHKQDEAYYVISGTAKITYGKIPCPDSAGSKQGELTQTDGITRDVKAGDLIFIPASTQHTFHCFEEDANGVAELLTLVFFSPNYTGSPRLDTQSECSNCMKVPS